MNLVEARLRYGLTPTWVLSAGAGIGIGAQSPDVQPTTGLQKGLLLPDFSPEHS